MERTPDQNNPEENTRGERSKKNEALPPLPTAISGGKSYRSDTYKYPGGGRTILGSFQRVKIEGRRGRGYWEWKAAELKKRASAEEADDELTSFESDSLKKISTSPPKSHVTFQQDLNFQNKERPNASFITDGNSRLTASSERVPVSGGVRVLPPYLPYQDIAGYTQKGVSASNDQPPSNEEEKSPVERITISSFSQPRLTPLLNRAQPPREPPSPSPSPPSGNSPTAPPKELVYADAESRRAARSQPALGQDHQSQGSSEPSKYSGVKQITYSNPQLISRGHNETSELKGSVSNERKNFNEEIRQHYHDDKLEGGQKSSDKSANEYYVPGTKISTSTYTGHSESSLSTSRHDNTLSSIPSLNSSKNYNDFEPETKPLLLQGSDDDLVKKKATKSPPAALGAARLDRASSLVPLSKLKPSEATCSQKNQSSERKSGALVWVSQPGGGAKLEWVPTPGLSTLRAVPASPQGSLRGNPSSHSQQPSRGTSNDVAGVAASKTQDATPKGIIKRGDEGGGGGGRRYGGYDEDARGGGSYMARVASDDPRAVRDGNVSHTGNSSRPSNCTGGYSSEDSSSDAFVAVPGAEAPVFNSSSSPSVKSKNVRSSAPGITRSAGRTYSPLAGNRALISQGSDKAIDSSNKAEEDKVVTVAGRTQGQTVRIRIRPEVHAYLSTLPVIRGCLGVQQPTGPVTTERRDSIHSANSSSASGLTLGSGEGSSGYQEQDYEAVIDEYTLLKKAVDEHDPEALRLLTATEAALYPEGGGGGSEYPYLREMKERLLIAKEDPVMGISDQDNQLLEVHQTPVSTVVRLNADGYGSHTSPTHRVESLYTGTLESRRTHAHEFFPKNAKTSTFITLSLLYATLLIVVCLGFVLSEVLTHNVPLYYYEAFFTYLYGLSIFFLLYVFCYLLTDSSGEIKTPNTQVYMVRLSSLPFYSRVNPVSNSRASLYRSWLL